MIHHRDNLIDILFERKNIAFAFLIILIGFALFYTPVRSSLTEMLYSFAPHMWKGGNSMAETWNSFLTNLRSKEALQSENDSLHADILRMQAQVLDRNLLNEKVNSLESALGRAQSDNRVLGNVFAGVGVSPYDTLVIDVGTDNGVSLGDVVVYAGSGIIGEIAETSNSSSKVKLFSSPNEEHLVLIGPNKIPAKATGKGMGNFESRVPQGSAVHVGDNVIVSNNRLLLGNVSSIESDPTLPLMRILFRSSFNITEISTVEVIVGK